ncbi:hypothetical protein JCM8097_003774 [Rhodosporidiobolus ruineniae]
MPCATSAQTPQKTCQAAKEQLWMLPEQVKPEDNSPGVLSRRVVMDGERDPDSEVNTGQPTASEGEELARRGGDDEWGPGDYGWGIDATITLTPDVATFTFLPTATVFETSVVVQEETTFQTLTSTFTAIVQASTATTLVLPPDTTTATAPQETVTVDESSSIGSSSGSSSETLPTTPPPWLTLTTSTSISTASSPSSSPTRAASAESACLPGDADQKEPGLFDPTHEQATTLYVMAIYLVGITVAWSLWGLRVLLYGFKSFTVLIHEAGHVLGIMLSGQPLYRFTIDPNAGGVTHTVPGRRLTALGLYLGQVFSILFGGVTVFVGFDTLASKYASFIIMAFWLPVIAFQANLPTRLVCVASLGLLIGIWFIDHATGLRYYLLFLGIMSSFYMKQNECCCVMLESNTAVPAMVWFATWFLVSLVVLIGFNLGALAYWRQSSHSMYCQGQSFAPT